MNSPKKVKCVESKGMVTGSSPSTHHQVIDLRFSGRSVSINQTHPCNLTPHCWDQDTERSMTKLPPSPPHCTTQFHQPPNCSRLENLPRPLLIPFAHARLPNISRSGGFYLLERLEICPDWSPSKLTSHTHTKLISSLIQLQLSPSTLSAPTKTKTKPTITKTSY